MTDPWDWTVEEVVTNICQKTKLYSLAGVAGANRPDSTALASRLKNHEITGRALLCRVDGEALRVDFALVSYDQREALISVIQLLRSQSPRYRVLYPNDVVSTSAPGQSPTKKKKKVALLTATKIAAKDLPAAVESDEWSYLADRWREDGELSPQQSPLDSPAKLPENNDIVQTAPTATSVNGEYHMMEDEENDNEENDDEDEDVSSSGDDDTELDGAKTGVHTIGRGGQGKLSEQQITDTINDFLAEYTAEWTPGRYPDEGQPFDAYQLWVEFQGLNSGLRQKRLDDTLQRIQFHEEQLDKFCKTITEVSWSSVRAVRNQCAVLNSSVDFLEQAKWERDVYESKTPPKRTGSDRLVTVVCQNDSDDILVVDRERSVSSRAGNAPDSRIPVQHHTEIIDLGSGSDSDSESDNMVVDNDSGSVHPTVEAIPRTHQDVEQSEDGDDGVDTEPSDLMVIDSIEIESAATGQSTQELSEYSQPRSDSSQSRPPPVMAMSPDPPLPSIHPHDSPSTASYTTISKWAWSDLVANMDRKRIIMKVLQEMPAPDREMLRHRLTLNKHNLINEISYCVSMRLNRQNYIPGILPRYLPDVNKFTDLFLCWWLADDYYNKGNVASEWRLRELKECLENGVRDPEYFCDWAKWVLEHKFSRKALQRLWQPSQEEIIVISDDEDDNGSGRRNGNAAVPGTLKGRGTPRTPKSKRDPVTKAPSSRRTAERKHGA